MGGVSSEREVSLHSGQGVARALKRAGHEVVEVVLDEEALGGLREACVDVAFLALHGAFGEDGGIQALLEEAGIAYTGCGPEASRVAMDKVASKERFAAAGVATPDYVVIDAPGWEEKLDEISTLSPERLVVKPSAQGSSIGVSIVGCDGVGEAISQALSYDGRAIVERFISGRELTVGVVGRRALPVIELRPRTGFFDYDAKYTKGLTEYVVAPELPDGLTQRAREAALGAFECLGCRDLGRVDMMADEAGGVWVLEVNTIPGFTETSLVPMAAAAVGSDFPALCDQIVRMALRRFSAVDERRGAPCGG